MLMSLLEKPLLKISNTQIKVGFFIGGIYLNSFLIFFNGFFISSHLTILDPELDMRSNVIGFRSVWPCWA